ncbi:MAG: hypothetical protein B7Y41_08135 [Hydrogenophilales bacterium 28-61-23]|nr:MAG: hypothetical protein B7Y41_08135 [Hydrogenophilales bacterium 28-61-23]
MSSTDLASGRITLPHLRDLIGLRVRHQGTVCVIMEVLETPPCLILEPVSAGPQLNSAANIMANLHGHPGEYGVESRMVQVLTDDQTGLNDALLELEILD